MQTSSITVKPKMDTRMLVSLAMLSAVSVALSFVEVTMPLSPSFVKLDVSDFPVLLAAFTFGPLAGVMVELIKNLIGLLSTGTGGIGELANFIIGAAMAFSAGVIYQRRRTLKGALLAFVYGSIVMAIVGSVVNYFILLPLFSGFMPMDAIIASFGVLVPIIKTKLDVILFSTIPFNLFKGALISAVTFLLYKRLSPFLKGGI